MGSHPLAVPVHHLLGAAGRWEQWLTHERGINWGSAEQPAAESTGGTKQQQPPCNNSSRWPISQAKAQPHARQSKLPTWPPAQQ